MVPKNDFLLKDMVGGMRKSLSDHAFPVTLAVTGTLLGLAARSGNMLRATDLATRTAYHAQKTRRVSHMLLNAQSTSPALYASSILQKQFHLPAMTTIKSDSCDPISKEVLAIIKSCKEVKPLNQLDIVYFNSPSTVPQYNAFVDSTRGDKGGYHLVIKLSDDYLKNADTKTKDLLGHQVHHEIGHTINGDSDTNQILGTLTLFPILYSGLSFADNLPVLLLSVIALSTIRNGLLAYRYRQCEGRADDFANKHSSVMQLTATRNYLLNIRQLETRSTLVRNETFGRAAPLIEFFKPYPTVTEREEKITNELAQRRAPSN